MLLLTFFVVFFNFFSLSWTVLSSPGKNNNRAVEHFMTCKFSDYVFVGELDAEHRKEQETILIN